MGFHAPSSSCNSSPAMDDQSAENLKALELEYQGLNSISDQFSRELSRQISELLNQHSISLAVPL